MVLTDLHCLCASTDRTEKHHNKVLRQIRYFPQEASQETESGSYPLHELLKNGRPTLDTVTSLVEAYPDAVNMEETMLGYYPLHIACRYGCDPKIVAYLLECNPECAHVRSRRFLLCCLQGWWMIGRGESLAGYKPPDLAERCLPPDHPNREAILKLFLGYQHYGDGDDQNLVKSRER